jgi:hypothetical protein
VEAKTKLFGIFPDAAAEPCALLVVADGSGVQQLDDGVTIASMKELDIHVGLTRREMLQLSTAGAAVLGAALAFPGLALARACY